MYKSVAPARAPRRRLRRHRRATGAAPRPADPGAAHPPGEGHVQHLHGAGPAGGDGRALRLLARPGRADGDRRTGPRPHQPAGGHAGGRQARGGQPHLVRHHHRRGARTGRRDRGAGARGRRQPPAGRRRPGRHRARRDHHARDPGRRRGRVRGRRAAGHGPVAPPLHRPPDERVPRPPGVPPVPVRDGDDALPAVAVRPGPGSRPGHDPARLVHDEAQRGSRDGARELARVRSHPPVRAAGAVDRLPADDRRARADAAGRHRLRRRLRAAQLGRAGEYAGLLAIRRWQESRGEGRGTSA